MTVVHPVFVWIRREQARETGSAPRWLFSPRYKSTGLRRRRRIPVDLIWQCGGAAPRSGSHGNRPERSDYCFTRASQQPANRRACARLATLPPSLSTASSFLFFNTNLSKTSTITMGGGKSLMCRLVLLRIAEKRPSATGSVSPSLSLSPHRASPSYGAGTFHSTVLSFVCEEAILRQRTGRETIWTSSLRANFQGVFETNGSSEIVQDFSP